MKVPIRQIAQQQSTTASGNQTLDPPVNLLSNDVRNNASEQIEASDSLALI